MKEDEEKTFMENKNVFSYRYSAKHSTEAQRIRSKYLPKEESKLERLRGLDRRVRSAGVIEGLVFGVIGALIFGIGLCFGLDVFPGEDVLTLVFMAIGAAIMIPAYPVYKRVARRTKEKLAPEIIRLSDEIIASK